jgi:surface protein
LANGTTIRYTGTAIDEYNLPTQSPLWIQEDPRGTGTPEWFAVVNNSSRDQIIDYVRSTGSAVSAYFTKSGQINPVPFNNIVTTYMTNFGYMMLSSSAFNKPISDWDTSNVTNMSQMFQYATMFNQDISKWNVAKVTDMSFMFFDADFYQDISGWITSSVRNMAHMFSGARKFNSDISGWNTLNVENMQNMFMNANMFNQNLSGWNVGKVTSRNYFASPALFANVALQPIWSKLSRLANGTTIRYTGTAQAVIDEYNLPTPSPLWIQEDPRGTGTPEWFAVVNNSSRDQIIDYVRSTGSAVSAYFTKSGQINPVPFNNIVTTYMTNFGYMMLSSSAFNKPISDWDTSNVTNMSQMFQYATMFNQDISKWNVAKVTDMSFMFFQASVFNQDISKWNVDNVLNAGYFATGSPLALPENSGKLPPRFR